MSGILGQDALGAFTLGVGSTLNLIYDRTAADVERAQYLNDLWACGVFLGTAEELAEWFTDLKGAYNAGDLNRVEGAVAYLSQLLRELPQELKDYAAALGVAWDAFFNVPYTPGDYHLTTKTEWNENGIQTPADMARYLANVRKLRGALDYETDALPSTMENLRFQGANAIEKALVGLENAIAALETATKTDIDNTAAAWFYSGELYSGEV